MATVTTHPTHDGCAGVADAVHRAGLLLRTLVSAMLVAAIAIGAPSIAVADFSGSYALDNWTVANTNANGSVVPSTGTATSITITGGDNGSFAPGATDFTIAAAAAGTVSFSWSYSSVDSNTFDLGGYCKLIDSTLPPCALDVGNVDSLADNLVLLATNDDSGASGTFSATVAGGEVFGFSVVTADNFGGPGVLTISEFSAPEPATGNQEVEAPTQIPVPATLGLLALGVTAARLTWTKRRAAR